MHQEQRGFILNKLDRKIKDIKAIGQTVYISKGLLKGYKGKVVYADEVMAQIQVFAKNNQTVSLPRDHLYFLSDTSAPLRMQNDAPIQISFDEAMNQEFVNQLFDEEGNPIQPKNEWDPRGNLTPVASPKGGNNGGWDIVN